MDDKPKSTEIIDMKFCVNSKCEQSQPLPLEAFHKHKSHKDGRNSACKVCTRKKTKEWAIANPDRYNKNQEIWKKNNKEKIQRYHKTRYKNDPIRFKNESLSRKYGITIDQYNEMVKLQNGVCKVCNKPETDKNKTGNVIDLSVDHNHTTGKVRGLLCGFCNRALGLLKEDTLIITNLLEYVKNDK